MIANAASHVPTRAARLRLSTSGLRLACVGLITLLSLCMGFYVLHRSGFSLARTSGTSMEPYLHQGDAVIIRTVNPDTLEVGDLVWFNRNGFPILHRVIKKYATASGATEMVTKGDNLAEPDGPLTSAEVRGRLALKVPWLGTGARLVGVRDGYIFGELAAIVALLATSVLLRAVRLSPVRLAQTRFTSLHLFGRGPTARRIGKAGHAADAKRRIRGFLGRQLTR